MARIPRIPATRSTRRTRSWILWVCSKRGNRKLECAGCGRKFQDAYDSNERLVRDLPWSVFRTTVHIEVHRVKCPGCRVKIEKVPLLPARRRSVISSSFARVCATSESWLIPSTKSAVAPIFNLGRFVFSAAWARRYESPPVPSAGARPASSPSRRSPHTKLVLSADLLKQLHCCSPVQRVPSASGVARIRAEEGRRQHHRFRRFQVATLGNTADRVAASMKRAGRPEALCRPANGSGAEPAYGAESRGPVDGNAGFLFSRPALKPAERPVTHPRLPDNSPP
jgi:zinc-finger of transposase IS204/IS1001/IS1096/IS1165